MHFTKDIRQYINTNCCGCKKTLKEISQSNVSDMNSFLVDSLKEAFSFDDIVLMLGKFNKVNWSSADALLLKDEELIFIEFKKGFEDKLSKEKIMSNKIQCPNKEIDNCTAVENLKTSYCDIFMKNREKEKTELLYNIKIKLLETLKFLECVLLPKCNDKIEDIKLKFLLVVDRKFLNGDPACAYDGMQKLMAKDSSGDSNLIIDKLIKYKHEKLYNKTGVYFDDIQVMDVNDYKQSLYY